MFCFSTNARRMTWSILQAPPPPLKREREREELTDREREREKGLQSLSWEELGTKEETERDEVV